MVSQVLLCVKKRVCVCIGCHSLSLTLLFSLLCWVDVSSLLPRNSSMHSDLQQQHPQWLMACGILTVGYIAQAITGTFTFALKGVSCPVICPLFSCLRSVGLVEMLPIIVVSSVVVVALGGFVSSCCCLILIMSLSLSLSLLLGMWHAGILGGSLWALGNLMVVPIIKLVGLGVGFLCWSTGNLVMGYFVGKFGLCESSFFFGLLNIHRGGEKEHSH